MVVFCHVISAHLKRSRMVMPINAQITDVITGLLAQGSTGRNYFVGVAVSRRDNISFQVLRFYPEGGAVFSDFISHIVPVGVTAYPGPSSELKRIS